MRPAARRAPERNTMLALIHIAKADLGMADDVYRSLLWGIGRVDSAAKLDHAGRERVLDHMKACGWRPTPSKRAAKKRPANFDQVDRGPLLSKIEALLLDAGRDWPYADGIAKQMFKVDSVQFCRPDQLHKIVAALMVERRRRTGSTS